MFTFSADNKAARAFPAALSASMTNDRKLLVEGESLISAWPPVTTPDRWPGFLG
jgi:hypothetical protein